MPYTSEDPNPPPDLNDLRARIPGWGVDLDPADRPSVPSHLPPDPARAGSHWHLPEQQPEQGSRERSIEHARITPVFGTACPPKGVSGLIRRLAYRRYSEARAAHWLLLLAADRVDGFGSHVTSWLRGRPENPFVETGLRTEVSHGVASRRGRRRVDTRHQLLDPVVVAAPGAALLYALYRGVRRLT